MKLTLFFLPGAFVWLELNNCVNGACCNGSIWAQTILHCVVEYVFGPCPWTWAGFVQKASANDV